MKNDIEELMRDMAKDYRYVRKEHLIDNYKTIEEVNLSNIEILTDTGYKELSHLMISKPFEQYIIKLENGYELNCADEHILFDRNFNEVYVKDLNIGDYVQTDQGLKKIISIDINKSKVSMCDTTVNDNNHRFYSNGILSHNSTTTAIYCLWVILFNSDKSGLVLSKSGPAGLDLIKKIKDMYLYLPYHLKIGTMKWNQSEISFDNNSSISTESFSPTAGLGKTINFLILDEFAWCSNCNKIFIRCYKRALKICNKICHILITTFCTLLCTFKNYLLNTYRYLRNILSW